MIVILYTLSFYIIIDCKYRDYSVELFIYVENLANYYIKTQLFILDTSSIF